MTEEIAVINDVSYSYPKSERRVLSRISMKIRKGEFLGLIGPTGAGKSTLCYAMNGIVPQFFGGRFFGEIFIAGLDTVDHPISTLSKYVCEVFEDPETQIEAYYKTVNDDLSVRKVEELVRNLHKKATKDPVKSERKKQIIRDFEDLQSHLSRFFSTDVQFRMNEKGKGKIVIPFEDSKDLQRIMGILDTFRS